MTRSLIHRRNTAFSHQSGRCYYCEVPMWPDNPVEFAAKYGMTSGQARSLRCTAEHLVARQDGGSNSRSNIVAACWFCNSHRHRRKIAPPPELYKQRVLRRIRQGRWHQLHSVNRAESTFPESEPGPICSASTPYLGRITWDALSGTLRPPIFHRDRERCRVGRRAPPGVASPIKLGPLLRPSALIWDASFLHQRQPDELVRARLAVVVKTDVAKWTKVIKEAGITAAD